MDKEKALEVTREYAKIVTKHFSVKEVVLYGSFAEDRAREYSDIDVAVIVDKLERDILDAQTLLFRLRHEVDVRIEPVLLEAGKDKSGFLEEVLKTGIKVYSSEISVE
ncbi:nucleotidyltransferase family protein [Halarsenatibacter silvermanii]|uniref:Nucleotidyltransferase domain-containing protein n=1 Tax=Halarsenatibacter silvermanii TaxID=321763 RepID=A0A1G9TZB6_9FIRM|nr:nucleotidyltransferase domain-containing protein [Halarsenatibacter silvermanii]SDM53087.1 Nucleotidyltransferase domain-containing protein [Halarsenatibacter silvermanii]